MFSTPKKSDEPTTPVSKGRKRRSDGETLTCTITQISDLIKSPNKQPWFECGATKLDGTKQRLVSWDTSFQKHIKNLFPEPDMKKVVKLNNVYKYGNAFKIDGTTTVEKPTELEKPIVAKNQNVTSLMKVRFQQSLDSYVSVRVNITSQCTTKSIDKQTIVYHYKIDDTTESMNLESFKLLDLKIGTTYEFHDLMIGMFKGSRILQWNVMSNMKESKKSIKITKENKKTIIKIVGVKEDSEMKCYTCHDPISPETRDSEGFYDCTNCGTFSDQVITTGNMTLHIKTDGESEITSNTLHLTDEVRKNYTKKDLIKNKWNVSIHDENITDMEKVVEV